MTYILYVGNIFDQDYQLISIFRCSTGCMINYFIVSTCFAQDPYLRNLESRFALQRKIVEAAKKLASEPDIGKTVKKKRRRNCLDAMQKLQEIEDEMNRYRVKKGKRPTQRASRIIAGKV